MISAANLRFQDYQFQYQVTTGVWRWTTRADLSGTSPVYQVRDIMSPLGLLRDSTPIPGAVVQAMGQSITQIQQNFPPRILIGPPTSLSFTVDEGRGFSTAQDLVLTNNGIFGSLLYATLTPSAPHICVTPGVLGSLSSNQQGSADVTVDSTTLLAASSPYSGSIVVVDPAAVNTPQTIPITITVRPKATIARTPTVLEFSVSKPLSGDFPPIASQTFAVQNTGPSGSVLDFQVQTLTGLATWLLGFAPTHGSVAASGSSTITVNIDPPANLMRGVYEETLRISGYSTNSFVDVLVRLTVI